MKSELEALRDKIDHLGVINRFAVEMLALNSEEAVLWHVAREVVSRLGFVDAVVYLLHEEDGLLRQHAAFGNKNPREYEILDPIEIPLGHGVVGRCAQTAQPLLISDTREFPTYIEDDAMRLSELAVPITDGEHVLGVIDSEHPQADFYTQDHLETLSTVASMTATKLKQVRTVLQLEQNVELLEYGKRVQETLFRIAELSITSESLDDFFRQLHQCMEDLTYAKNFYIALDTGNGSGIQYHYAADEKHAVDGARVYPVEGGRLDLVAYIMQSESTLLLTRAEIDALVRDEIVARSGSVPASLVGAPFGAGTGKRGVVMIQSYDDNLVYQDRDRDLLAFVSKHIHNAIERTRARENLTYLALHDSLTGLPNRSLFMDRLQHALERRSRDESGLLGVLFLDLDRFKAINDRYGHQAGDEFLAAIAERIAGCLRSSDTLCRQGGDEFAVLIETATSSDQVVDVAKRILETVVEPLWINGARIRTTTSIGIACDDGRGVRAEKLLREADEAMYQAKARGRNHYRMFQADKSGAVIFTYRMERDLPDAIAAEQFYLEYQPIVELVGEKIVSAEALVRWNHPEHGLITPSRFIPDAEDSGLVSQIDLAVVSMAVRWLEEMGSALPEQFRLSVNLSGQSLVSRDTVAALRRVLSNAHVTGSRLYVEVTERALVENMKDARRAIEALRELDVRVALDDFGTGYSSLSYLSKLPLDALKIDRSFIGNMKHNHSNVTIVETIVGMAKALGMSTVAEGIETHWQAERLTEIGCTLGQGFYFCYPLPDKEIRTLLAGNTS